MCHVGHETSDVVLETLRQIVFCISERNLQWQVTKGGGARGVDRMR